MMKKRLLSLSLALVLLTGLCLPAAAAEFSDVPASHWAYSAIQETAAQGIVSGYEDGTFRPDAGVNFAEFCAYVGRAFYPEEVAKHTDGAATFGWYYPYIYGIQMEGVLAYFNWTWADVTFSLDRYTMAQILYGVLHKNAPATASEAPRTELADWGSVPEDAQKEVALCVSAGVITGMSDGSFSGGKGMTRAQACVVIQRLQNALDTHVLTNGKPITEENVLELLDELKVKYPYNSLYMDPSDWYRSDAIGIIGTDANQAGCNGWASFASDYIFGQFSNNKPRKLEDPTQSRPGDIIVFNNEEGFMRHAALLTSRIKPAREGGLGCWDTAHSSGRGNKVVWSDTTFEYENNSDLSARYNGRSYEIWTRYPEG